jgi:thiosulfate dehydrogenase
VVRRNNPGLRILIVFLSLLCLGAAAQFQSDLDYRIRRGAQFYEAWDQILRVNLLGYVNPLWEEQDYSTLPAPFTWRCVTCHGWDYRGVDGEFGEKDSQYYTGFPGILTARDMTEAEITAWLTGQRNQKHDFSRYLTLDALEDLIMFLKFGLADYTEEIGVFDQADLSLTGEELYKNSCRDCHGSDGALINFGTVESPVFIGDLSESPWQMVHLIRFGHSYVYVPSSDEMGWEQNDIYEVINYTKALPRSQEIVDEEAEILTQGYLDQADTAPMVYFAVAIALVTFASVIGVSMNKRNE